MPSLYEIQREIGELRTRMAEQELEARTTRLRTDSISSQLEAARRTGDESKAAEIERRIVELEESAREAQAAAAALRERLKPVHTGLAEIPIEELIGRTDDHLPFLLFPVRLETKFRHGDQGLELRVRIFPDDINISSHDPLLTEAEQSAGTSYWAERARAAALPATERRTAEQGAWSMLAARFGGPRARYVARATRPDEGAGGEAPLRTAATPPRTRLLPDHFVVMALDEAGGVIAQEPGRPIPDPLPLAPDPEAAIAELDRGPDDRLVADPKLAWLIDYDQAVEVGMAVTLPVTATVLRTGISRVIALGVRLSMDPLSSARAVEEMLSDHRFTAGIDLVAQGSPTNNSDSAPSQFTTGLDADEALVAQEVDGLVAVGVLEHDKKSDTQRLAEALGISLAAVADWPGAHNCFDVADALAMNRALWPATIGTFLDELVEERVAPPLRAAARDFFLTYVTGRGLLPVIRVGSQPYGILPTSDLKKWHEEQSDEGAAVADIARGIEWLRGHFDALIDTAPQMGRGDDPLAMSLRVIGQLASSVSFSTRKAVSDEWSWNTLVYEGLKPGLILDWWELLQEEKARSRQALGLSGEPTRLERLTFLQASDPWTGPIIDRDPKVPLSETELLSLADGSRNYIDWLLSASSDDLRAERFTGPDGQTVSAPRALLYRLLYRAWTKSLVRGVSDLVSRLRPDLVVPAVATGLNNVGAGKQMADADAPFLDAARLGLAANPRALGDLVLDASMGQPGPAMPEAFPIISQRAALEHLAARPTAVLERVFAEHVDLVSYRLDAWQTGLVARRLDRMRRREGRAEGIHVGAYGYVENLHANVTPLKVDTETLPESLRNSAPVTEQPENGGFVHAPSLTHAVTAAVLRNAYLTHANTDLKEVMSVNLTSRRVRKAMEYVEGLRAGQELAAMLGYQFERGLHEHHPGIELDAFIYVLRARFPLVSNRLTAVPGGVAAELIEARNVVDGYELLKHVRNKTYGQYGIAGLPAEGSAEALALVSEILDLEATLDAIADVMTAETVHQAVQSNMERTRGMLGALADGDIPQLPDVVQTPRSGRVVTQRVTLHLGATQGWLAAPSPRAKANPRLNAWLAAQLPPPASIGFETAQSGEPGETVTLDTCGLDAIDVVLMSADRFGDGSSELERWLAERGRLAAGVDDAVATAFSPGSVAFGRFIVDLSQADDATPLGSLLSLIRSLRRLVGGARGLDALDHRLPGEADKAPTENPRGIRLVANGDVDVLPARILQALTDLELLSAALKDELALLKMLHDAAAENPTNFDPGEWALRLAAVRTQLRAIALYGLPSALPQSATAVTLAAGAALHQQATAVQEVLVKRLARAAELIAPLPAEPASQDPTEEARRLAGRIDRRIQNLQDAARELLGGGFVLQPVFELQNDQQAEFTACLGDPVEQDPLVIEGWLQGLARVRPSMADIALTSTFARWVTGMEPELVPIQLPRPAGQVWAAVGDLPKTGDVMSLVAIDPPGAASGPLEGLLLDEWTEVVPTTHETTGLAFQFDRPSAAAPQAILIAIPPNPDGRWQWSELVGAVTDTFDRARQRAVELDQVAASPLFMGLPMTMMPFSRGHFLDSVFLQSDAVTAALHGE
jgi:hypothetical protein